MQMRLGPPEFFLGPYLLGDVLQRTGDPHQLSGGVPGGLAACAKVAILAGASAEPVRHVVELSVV